MSSQNSQIIEVISEMSALMNAQMSKLKNSCGEERWKRVQFLFKTYFAILVRINLNKLPHTLPLDDTEDALTVAILQSYLKIVGFKTKLSTELVIKRDDFHNHSYEMTKSVLVVKKFCLTEELGLLGHKLVKFPLSKL
jgi:hypothetical protein